VSFLGNLFGERKSNHLRTENIDDPGVKKGIDNLMGKPVQITGEGDHTDISVQKSIEFYSKDSNGKNFSGLESRMKLGNYGDRMSALDELKGDRSSKAIEILSWLMHNGNSNLGEITKFDERAIAAGFLGKIGGEGALRELEEARKIPDIENDVKHAIIEVQRNSDINVLLDGLSSTQPVPYLTLLIERKDTVGVPKAMELLDSSSITTAVYAARYLGVVKYEGAVDKLIMMMKSKLIDYQHVAGVALGRIGGAQAKEALFSSLNASSKWAKSGAVKGLAFMFVNGELDIKQKIQGLDLNKYRECICSKDDDEEKRIHNMVVDKLLQ